MPLLPCVYRALSVGALLSLLVPPSVASVLSGLPLVFEPNVGQTEDSVRFVARGEGYTVFLTDTEAVVAAEGATVRMQMVGGAPASLVAEGEGAARINYLKGNDRARWRRDVPTYSRVRATGAYPGIDIVYYGAYGVQGGMHQLEYDFVVQPGADPAVIRLRYEGIDTAELRADGTLSLRTSRGGFDQSPPVVYQEEANGRRTDVAGRYVVDAERNVSFSIGAYDRSRQLVIDPRLIYSTYLGGDVTVSSASSENLGDRVADVAIDKEGNIYVVGTTTSLDFPVAAGSGGTPFQVNLGAGPASCQSAENAFTCDDIFVAKLSATGKELVYATYLGSRRGEDGVAIAVDKDERVAVAGHSFSDRLHPYPTTLNAFQGPANVLERGSFDVVVTLLDESGTDLVYSTYLRGGGGSSLATAIEVDATFKLYVVGTTQSASFPTRNGFLNSFPAGPNGFLSKLDPLAVVGSDSLLYGTYIAGNQEDKPLGVAVDTLGAAYVVGRTTSSDLPVKALVGQALQPSGNGGSDGFVAKVNPSATGAASLIYLTYFGGAGVDEVTDIAVDSTRNAYLTGFTSSSTNFPLRNAFDSSALGSFEPFVAKLNGLGTALLYSTFLGGGSEDRADAITIDSAGNAYVSGGTFSDDFPSRNAFQPLRAGDFDAFVAKIGTAPSSQTPVLLWSSYLGGEGGERSPVRLALNPSGSLAISGTTTSSAFPTTLGALKEDAPGISSGNREGFVAKLDAAFPATIGLYRPGNGQFVLRNSNTPGTPGFSPVLAAIGLPVVGDWNGDGHEDLAVYDQGDWTLHIASDAGTTTMYQPFATIAFGGVGDLPLVGDWDGDGVDTIGVFRPSDATFLLRNSNTAGNPDLVVNFGFPGAIPLVGDWDGDGDTTIGIVDPASATFLLRNENAPGNPDFQAIFGLAGDLPVAGDWDGDGAETIGIFRNGLFALRNANSTGAADLSFSFGQAGDLPLAGDWDLRP